VNVSALGVAGSLGAPTSADQPSVHLLGIRHHGPGSARSLGHALDALQPDAVLIELPAEADALFGFVDDVDMAPPVALLGYVVDHPERAAFYPFATFSPEWCALRWAAAHRVPAHAIDLALAHLMASPGDASEDGSASSSSGRAAGPPVDPIGQLAAAAGYDDPERWWEDVVEHRASSSHADGGPDVASHDDALASFAALAEAMAIVRAGMPDASGREAQREATMRQAIRRAQRSGARTIAVVCGAWHVPALVHLDPASADAALLRGLAKVKVAMTWVPWSHRRLARAGGYGAGVASPGWYAHVYEHPGPDGVTAWFVDAARLLRSHDHDVSPDHLIAASRLASSTAALRDRPVPGLDEALDAALAVLAGGRPGPLQLIHDELVVGDRLGSVPESTPMVPLARDVLASAKRARLKQEAAERVVELDLRTPQGRARSHLLHRLLALGVPWGRPDDGRRSSGTFRESWRLRWDPELAIRLIEASAHGTTVVAAATNRLRERLDDAMTLADLTALIESALFADLPDAVVPAMARLAARAALDPDVSHLMDALAPLTRTLRYGDVRDTDASALRAVVDGLVGRVIAGAVQACTSLADDAAAPMAERLAATQAALALVDHPARGRGGAWPAVLASIARRDQGHGLVHGRATRLLHDLGAWDGDAVGRRLAQALSVGTAPTVGAAFVEGFLAGSGVVLLHDGALVELLDGWLATLPEDAFVDVAPLLRRTFGAFELAERRQLGELVSGRGDGRPPAPFGWDLDPARAAAAIATVGALLGVAPTTGVVG